MSSRSSSRSFHNDVIASGACSPALTVMTNRADPVNASWCTSVAERLSR
jgi:hypothetical protein